MLKLTLFITSHCHLCEQAADLVTQLNLINLLTLVEITDDNQLLMTYGERIPVLQKSDNLSELGWSELDWPFTIDELTAFINL